MRDDATNMKSKLLLEFMPAARLKIKCNSAVEQNFQCQIKKTLFRLDPHLISSSQTAFRAKREQFSFSFMHKLGITEYEGEMVWRNRMLDKHTQCACWKGMHERCWISIKRVVWNIFCSVSLSTHPFRYIASLEIIRTQHVWLLKHQKRAPEMSEKSCFEHLSGGQCAVVKSTRLSTSKRCDNDPSLGRLWESSKRLISCRMNLEIPSDVDKSYLINTYPMKRKELVLTSHE